MKYLNRKNFKNLFNNRTFKNGSLFAVFAILNNGLNFLIILILSFYLSKDDFGLINLFNIFTLVISVLITLGSQSYFSVVFFKKPHKELKYLLTGISIITICVFFIFFIVLALFSNQLTVLLNFSLYFQLLGLLFCFFQIFYFLLLEYYRLEEKVVYYGILTTFWILSNLVLTYVLCVWLDYGWTGRVIVQISVSIPFFVFAVIFLFKKELLYFGIPSKKYFKELLNYGLPLVPHSSTVWMRQGLDRYFINWYYSSAAVGTYSLVYNFAGLIMMMGTAFNSSNSIFIFKELEKNDQNTKLKIRKLTKFSSFFFFTITILVVVFLYLFIKYLSPKYYDALPFIIPLCLMGFFQCLYYLYVNSLFFFGKTKGLMYITFSISIVHVLFSFILVRYSYLYLAYINLFSTLIICILVYLYSNKIYPLYQKK